MCIRSNHIQAIFLERLAGIGSIMEQQILDAMNKDIKVEVRSKNCCPFSEPALLTPTRKSSSLAVLPVPSLSENI